MVSIYASNQQTSRKHAWLACVDCIHDNFVFTGGKLFLLSKTKFTSAERIPQHLLESVSTCYSQKMLACTWCFLTHLPSTRKQLQSMTVAATGICKKCLRNNGTITVIPASDLCEASCYGNFVAIPPTPHHTNNIRAFQCCKKYEKISDHKKCLLLTRRGNAWFPHSVEEIVIWTIEYKKGKIIMTSDAKTNGS